MGVRYVRVVKVLLLVQEKSRTVVNELAQLYRGWLSVVTCSLCCRLCIQPQGKSDVVRQSGGSCMCR